MKKPIALFFLFLILCSCSSDVKFNSPGFQGRKDNFDWQANLTNGKIRNGKIIIDAFLGTEQVTFTVVAPLSTIFKNNPVIHKFGITTAQPINENEAIYKNTVAGELQLYKTNTTQSNGQLEITTFDFTSRKLSGKFRFNATYQGLNLTVAKNVNFQDGFIFDIILN